MKSAEEEDMKDVPENTSIDFHPSESSTTNIDNSTSNYDNGAGDKHVQFNTTPEEENNNNSSITKLSSRFIKEMHKKASSSLNHIDLATGQKTVRKKSVKMVHAIDRNARTKFSKLISKCKKVNETDDDINDDDSNNDKFRITSSNKHRHNIETSMLIRYLNWTFKASFTEVYIMTFIIYMILIIIFALFIYIHGQYQTNCINFTVDKDKTTTFFVDALHLSWTTLSTVGYGVISPVVEHGDNRCYGTNVLMAMEAFVGVLFGGVTGAIIFSKVARVQSIAQVRFSYPICVEYGTGAMGTSANVGFDRNADDDDSCDSPGLPCPILQFRLINLLSAEKGGEIMDASVNVVACIVDDDDENNPNASRSNNRNSMHSSMVGQAAEKTTKVVKNIGSTGTKAATASVRLAQNTGVALFGAGKRATNVTGSLIQQLNRQLMGKGNPMITDDSGKEGQPYNDKDLENELEKEFERRFAEKLQKQQAMMGGVTFMQENQTSVAVDEGNSKLAPPRTYHKLEVETNSHPFFKRVWVIRHVLNEQSPLLSYKARRMISENKGYWPESLNDYKSIRDNLYFAEIIVSFSGTANVSGSSVYAQKVYEFSNVNVGYTFANVLVKSNGKLIVDAALLNDVKEQVGGGAEPLHGVKQGNFVTDTAVMIEKEVTNTAQTVVETTKAATEGATMAMKATMDEAKGAMMKTDNIISTGISKLNKTSSGNYDNDNEKKKCDQEVRGDTATTTDDFHV